MYSLQLLLLFARSVSTTAGHTAVLSTGFGTQNDTCSLQSRSRNDGVYVVAVPAEQSYVSFSCRCWRAGLLSFSGGCWRAGLLPSPSGTWWPTLRASLSIAGSLVTNSTREMLSIYTNSYTCITVYFEAHKIPFLQPRLSVVYYNLHKRGPFIENYEAHKYM